MKTKKTIYFLVLAVLSVNFTGCIGVNGNFKRVRNHVLDNLNESYHKNIEFSVGPTGMAMASTFVSFADDDEAEIAAEMTRNVNRVQIGIYENRNGFDESCDFSMAKEISNIMEDEDWEYIVRTVSDDEMALVFIKSNQEIIHHMFVVALSNEQLVLAEIRGNLDKIAEIAIREHGLKFNVAHVD